jgi:transcriptional regulator with XRE-family HTH domain
MEIGKLLNTRIERLWASFKDAAFRHSWVESSIKNGVAFQLRSLRKAKGWDQKRTAEMVMGDPKLQSMVSRYENPDYGKYTLRTLMDFAKAFDVALVVRFVPFSKLLRMESEWENESLSVPPYAEDQCSPPFGNANTNPEAYIRRAHVMGSVLPARVVQTAVRFHFYVGRSTPMNSLQPKPSHMVVTAQENQRNAYVN